MRAKKKRRKTSSYESISAQLMDIRVALARLTEEVRVQSNFLASLGGSGQKPSPEEPRYGLMVAAEILKMPVGEFLQKYPDSESALRAVGKKSDEI